MLYLIECLGLPSAFWWEVASMDKSANFWDGVLELWLCDLMAVGSASLNVNFLFCKIHVKIVPTSIVSKTLRTQYTLAVAIVFVHCLGALPQSFMVETSRYDISTYGSQWAGVRLDLRFAEQKPSQQSVLLTVKHPISSPLMLIFRKVSCVKVCTTMRHPLMDPSIVICWALCVELKNPKLFLPSSYVYHSHFSDRAGYSPRFTHYRYY